jgi:ribosomal protein S27E
VLAEDLESIIWTLPRSMLGYFLQVSVIQCSAEPFVSYEHTFTAVQCTDVLSVRVFDMCGRAVVNSAGTVAGVVGVAVAGTMLESNERDNGGARGADESNASSSGWSVVFGVAAGVSYLCAGLFAVFASVDDQFRTRGKALHDGDLEDRDLRSREKLVP